MSPKMPLTDLSCFFSKIKTTQISCLELMPKAFISTALITGSPPINPLSGAQSETFPVVRKRYDGFDILFFFHGHGCGLGFLEQAESFLCWNNFGGEGENPEELCSKTKNNSPALQMSSTPQLPEAALSSDSVLAPSLLLGLCKTNVLISEKDRYYECHRAWLPQLSQQEFHDP